MLLATLPGNSQLVHLRFRGQVTLDDIIKAFSDLCLSRKPGSSLYLITDYREAAANDIHLSHIPILARFVNRVMTRHFRYIRWANLTAQPIQTSVALLFQKQLDLHAIDYRIFTTLEAATRHAAGSASLFH